MELIKVMPSIIYLKIGGLKKELFSLAVHQLLDPSFGLFCVAASRRSVYPNPMSYLVPYHLKYFEFTGIIIAKAIADNIPVDAIFTNFFLKHILGFNFLNKKN